jgi:NifB/MoaA-like Fe-S oxidoreductase
MPGILETIAASTGAKFELIPAVNSLFGDTVTTAGLLVGRDVERVLAGRDGFDMALIPAETLNDDAKFLDDRTLESVRATVPMPLHPSYDFIDVLGEPALIPEPV